jgi:hypothetical protein
LDLWNHFVFNANGNTALDWRGSSIMRLYRSGLLTTKEGVVHV